MRTWSKYLHRGGLPVVVSGPSGVGKDAVLAELGRICPGVKRCVTTTTRPPREDEIAGVDYTFVSLDEFKRGVVEGEFLEHAEFCGNLYGTPKRLVEEQLAAGVDVVLKIDIQGGLAIKRLKPEAVLVFLVPPSIEELERRLRTRGTESQQVVDGRLKRALVELEHVSDYDYVIENDSVGKAAEDLGAVIVAEHCRVTG